MQKFTNFNSRPTNADPESSLQSTPEKYLDQASFNSLNLRGTLPQATHQNILQLQRTYGNQAVLRLLNRTPYPHTTKNSSVIQRTVSPGLSSQTSVKGTSDGTKFEGVIIEEIKDFGYKVKITKTENPGLVDTEKDFPYNALDVIEQVSPKKLVHTTLNRPVSAVKRPPTKNKSKLEASNDNAVNQSKNTTTQVSEFTLDNNFLDTNKDNILGKVQDFFQTDLINLVREAKKLEIATLLPISNIIKDLVAKWFEEKKSQIAKTIDTETAKFLNKTSSNQGTALSEIAKHILDNPLLKLPDQDALGKRYDKLINSLLPELGKRMESLAKTNQLDNSEQKILAGELFRYVEKDLNIFRPDFEEWSTNVHTMIKDEGILEKFKSTKDTQAEGHKNIRQDIEKKGGQFSTFDQGTELSYKILTKSTKYPPSIWGGVCDGKVMHYLLTGDVEAALTLQEQDVKMQQLAADAEYLQIAQAVNKASNIEGKEPVTLTDMIIGDSPKDCLEKLKSIIQQEPPNNYPFKIALYDQTRQGSHAIAAQRLDTKMFNIYDPNLGLIKSGDFDALFNEVYLDYVGFQLFQWTFKDTK